MVPPPGMATIEKKLYNQAFLLSLLSLFTIFYNLFEGILSMVLGVSDETLSLFGFGADSFIEVISGIGIAMMIMRIRQNPESNNCRCQLHKGMCLHVAGIARFEPDLRAYRFCLGRFYRSGRADLFFGFRREGSI